ncbi:MAG: peptidoglycan DD-metalloendopeptidase family protein [Synergistaceae bacterium]|nr:peptidoglycan DD-metalloendopeptidase family protein [Synergistaceae bacterium]
MKKKIRQYNEIAKKKSQESKTLLSRLSRLRQSANDSQEKMQDLERENSRLQSSVSELNKRIKSLNESMSVISRTLRARIIDMYKFMPEENTLSLYINSDSPHDAINTAYILRRFAAHDLAMFEDLRAKEQELISARKQLEQNKSRIQTQTNELRKKRDEFDSTIKKTDSLLRSAQSEQKKAESAAKELEAAQRAIGNKITSLMNQKKAAAQKAASKPKSSPARNSGKNHDPVLAQREPVQPKSVPAPGAGIPSQPVNSLAWPVNGTVTMQYGSRVHPTFKTKIFNSGIDIKAAPNTPVKAAGPGEVLYQGWLRGFGQVVIIDHGNDLSTVYAHLNGASVREGAAVKTGTVIGRVGNSGTDSEYALHFEVRKKGSAQNPMKYLR